MKDKIKALLHFFKLDVTKNMQYDRLTNLIFKNVIKEDSNCIDIGCHKGEILEIMLNAAPKGQHFAFEPIPVLFDKLQAGFGGQNCQIMPYALSDEEGKTTFNYVKNAPAYSGLNKRKYAVSNPEIQEIEVEIKTLDDLIPNDLKIDLIKIDVEGAEFKVLKGAQRILCRDSPVVVFECGLGASDFYDTDPTELFVFFEECGLRLSTLKAFIKGGESMLKEEFLKHYESNSEYYFVGHP